MKLSDDASRNVMDKTERIAFASCWRLKSY